jgi:hypothetical protein
MGIGVCAPEPNFESAILIWPKSKILTIASDERADQDLEFVGRFEKSERRIQSTRKRKHTRCDREKYGSRMGAVNSYFPGDYQTMDELAATLAENKRLGE